MPKTKVSTGYGPYAQVGDLRSWRASFWSTGWDRHPSAFITLRQHLALISDLQGGRLSVAKTLDELVLCNHLADPAKEEAYRKDIARLRGNLESWCERYRLGLGWPLDMAFQSLNWWIEHPDGPPGVAAVIRLPSLDEFHFVYPGMEPGWPKSKRNDWKKQCRAAFEEQLEESTEHSLAQMKQGYANPRSVAREVIGWVADRYFGGQSIADITSVAVSDPNRGLEWQSEKDRISKACRRFAKDIGLPELG